MDLVDTLRKKIDSLEDGAHVPGLKAVLLHLETAFRHLSRGQDSDDDTAFTDAIYRTNQAFEGSIKEAYRVLADQDPAKKRPYDIENYLEHSNVFRSRVLSQLTTYRTEWRNPSAHDYKLDFDESEAFLAIVSVSAFACLLLDEIAERLAFKKSRAEAEAQRVVLAARLEGAQQADLLVRVAELLTQFCSLHVTPSTVSARQSEVQVIGALHGFLSSTAAELQVQTEVKLDAQRFFRADLLIARGDDRVVVELKRVFTGKNYENAIAQVEQYLRISGIKSGVLLFLPEAPSEMDKVELKIGGIDGRLVVLTPFGTKLPLRRTASGG
jgi:hypothetical protein